MPTWFERLSSPRALAEAAVRVGKRAERGGATAVVLREDPEAAAVALAAALRRREYAPRPARVRIALLDRPRELFQLEIGDAILHDALAALIAERLEPLYGPHIYSYRVGRSSWGALRDLLARVRQHRGAHREARGRGLFVLRCDIKRYGESVPMHPRSPLWVDLAMLFSDGTEDDWRFLVRLVRQTVIRPQQDEASPLRGLPIGSPLATILCNLYLLVIDAAMERSGCFYMRFGDDILLVAEDAEQVRRARVQLEAMLAARGLRLSAEKMQLRYWNGAGRGDPANPEFAGAAVLDYLGARLGFAGTISLPRVKLREALGDVRARLRNAAGVAGGADREARARLLCAVARETPRVQSTVSTHYAPWLRSLVSDRQQLKQLDYLLALQVAELVSGKRGPGAFSVVSYRDLRVKFGLPSLVVQRNRGTLGG